MKCIKNKGNKYSKFIISQLFYQFLVHALKVIYAYDICVVEILY